MNKYAYTSKTAYAKTYNMATRPLDNSGACGTTYIDSTKAKGVEGY